MLAFWKNVHNALNNLPLSSESTQRSMEAISLRLRWDCSSALLALVSLILISCHDFCVPAMFHAALLLWPSCYCWLLIASTCAAAADINSCSALSARSSDVILVTAFQLSMSPFMSLTFFCLLTNTFDCGLRMLLVCIVSNSNSGSDPSFYVPELWLLLHGFCF